MTICEPLLQAIPGATVRPVTLADIPAVTSLMRRVSLDAIGEADANESEVRDDLSLPRFDMAADTALVLRDGVALVFVQAHDEHDERAFIDVFVDTELDDELFSHVADRAIAGAIARLREALAARSGEHTVVQAGLYQQEKQMAAAYARAGLQRSRVYWRMTKDLSKSPVTVDVPPGVTIRSVDPDDDDVMRLVVKLRNETFSEHHGNVDMKIQEFAERWRESSKYDRKAWWIAYRGDEPVGLCLGNESKSDSNAGYIPTLGVVKASRGQGIARALLFTAFAEYRSRGRSSVELGVDSSNETGATRLYESVGMTTKLAIDSMELRLSTHE